jgi:hypothetical protein
MRALTIVALVATVCLTCGPASASGTARIQQPDGSVKTYTGVQIRGNRDNLALTSSDGKGTIVFARASCTKIGELLECLTYDATLFQNGQTTHIPLKSGTVWYNPSDSTQTLSNSSTQLPHHGILLTAESKRGTYVSLNGVLDGTLSGAQK